MTIDRPIGIFDSGLGGLTVLRALRQILPAEDLRYIGDTARLPYGAKTQKVVTQFCLEAAAALVDMGSKIIVIACNTATAAALPALQAAYPDIPVIGTIEPGAAVAAKTSPSGRIAVLATAATIKSGAYEKSIRSLVPTAKVTGIPAPLLVALVEEGWLEGPIAEAISKRYLAPVFSGPDRPDSLVMGCTHFPLLNNAIENVLPLGTNIVDPAEATAQEVKNALAERNLLRPSGQGTDLFHCTDAPDRFAAVGAIFLQQPLKGEDIRCITLG